MGDREGKNIMMDMIKNELKVLFKGKLNIFLLILILICPLFIGTYTVYSARFRSNGQENIYRGMTAIKEFDKAYRSLNGPISKNTLLSFNKDQEKMTDAQLYYKYYPLLYQLNLSRTKNLSVIENDAKEFDIKPFVTRFSTTDIANSVENTKRNIRTDFQKEKNLDPSTNAFLDKQIAHQKFPLNYYASLNWDSISDLMNLLNLVLAVLLTVCCSQFFYLPVKNKEQSFLMTLKFGRKKLHDSKILASNGIAIIFYTVAIILYLTPNLLAEGITGLRTSVNISIETFLFPYTMGQLIILQYIVGLISILFMVNIFIFLLYKTNRMIASLLSINILAIITFAVSLPTYTITKWIHLLSPLSGLSILYAMKNSNFLKIGSFYFFTYPVMIFFSIIGLMFTIWKLKTQKQDYYLIARTKNV